MVFLSILSYPLTYIRNIPMDNNIKNKSFYKINKIELATYAYIFVSKKFASFCKDRNFDNKKHTY